MHLLRILTIGLWLVLFLVEGVEAQSNVNLQRKGPLTRQGTSQLRTYLDLAVVYTEATQYDSLYWVIQKALPLSIRLNTLLTTARLYYHLGLYYRYTRGQFEQSILALKKSQRLLEQLKDTTYLPGVLYRLGTNYYDKGDYQQASKQTLSNLVYFEERKLTEWMARTCTTLRGIYLALQDKNRARYYTDKFFQLNQHSTDPQNRATEYYLKAVLYEEANKYALALPYWKKFMTLTRKIGNPINIVFGLSCLATNLRHQNRPYEALAHLQTARQLGMRIRSNADLGIISIEKSENYLQLHQIPLALQTANEAIEFGRQSKKMDLFIHALTNLAKIQEQAGDFRSALRNLELQHMLSDSLTSLKKAEAIAQIQTKYDVAKQENDILLLTKNAQIQKLKSVEQDRQLNLAYQRQLVFIVSLSTLFLLLSVIGYFLYRARLTQQQLTQQNEAMEAQALELQEVILLKNRLFSVVGHDLRSPVASLKARLILSKQTTAGAGLQELNQLEQEVNGLQHTLDNLLYWSLDQQNGLIVTLYLVNLTELVSTVLEGFEGLIQLKQLRIIVEQRPFYVQTDENLTLLVLRNLLHNAIKFTPTGKHIKITSQHQGERASLIIADEGIGMNLKESNQSRHRNGQGTGLGLQLSQELMNRMGGFMDIRSQPGQGTIIVLNWLDLPD